MPRTLRPLVCALAVAALGSPAIIAQPYNWDPTFTATATGGGPGTWDTTTANWFNAATNTDVVWPGAGNVANFGGSAGGLVGIAAAGVSADGLTFNTDGYTIGGPGTLTLTGTTPTITINTGLTGTVSAPIAGTAGMTVTGGGTLVLSGANTYSNTTTLAASTIITSGTVRLDTGGTLGAATAGVILGNTATTAAAAPTTPANLTLNTNATIGGFAQNTITGTGTNTLTIASGQTLTVNGPFTVGNIDPAGTASTTRLTVTGSPAGTGSLVVSAGTGNFFVGGNSSGGSGLTAVLDMSGISSFGFTGGEFNLGGRQANTTGNRANGQVTLASGSNTITATSLNIGAGSNSNAGANNVLTLGTSATGTTTNTINADSFFVGTHKSTGTIQFGAGSGTLTIRNRAGTGRAAITLGSHQSAGTPAAKGSLLFNGHSIDVLASTVIVGQITSAATTPGGVLNNSVQFDTGTFDVTSIILGQRTGTTTVGALNSSLTVGGGTLIVNSATGPGGGVFTMGSNSATGATTTAATPPPAVTSTFNLNGGTALVNANILIGTQTAPAGGATPVAATINLQGGVLDLLAHSIGSAAGAITITMPAAGQTATLRNVAGINGAAGLNMNGAGTLILAGSNTYTGGTTLTSGQLNLNTAAAIGPGTLTINGGTLGNSSGGAIALANNNPQTWGGDFTFAGPNDLNLGTGAVTLTGSRQVTVSAGSLTVGGVIGDGGGGFGLTKAGPGTLTLGGNNSYTGTTSVTGGTLRLAPTLPYTAPGGYSVAGGAALNIVNPTGAATLTVPTLSLGAGGGNSALGFELNTSALPTAPLLTVSTSDGLTLNGGTHTINVSDTQVAAVGSYTLIQYAGAPITSGFTIGTLPTPRTAANLDFSTAGQIKLNITGVDTVVWVGNVSNNWDFGTSANVGGTFNWKLSSTNAPTNFVTGDIVRFDDSATAFTVNVTTAVQPAAVTVNNSANTYTFSGPGSIASGSLTKQGTGTLVLLTNNTSTGTTTVAGGTLQIGNGGTAGAIAGDLEVTTPGTAVFNRSDDTTYAGIVSGTGSVTKSGTNTLTLTGTYTPAGTTTISGGTLALSPTTGYTLGGTVTGDGALSKGAAGAVTLTGTNTYSGGTTLAAGTLNLNSPGAIGTGTLTITGGTLGNTSGAAVTLTTNNTQTWGGDFTFAGPNDLNLGNGAVLLSATRVVTASAGNLTVGGPIVDAGAGFGLTKAGAGTLSLTGASTYLGPTTISAGTLSLSGGNNRLSPSGTLVFANNSTGTFDIGSTSQTLFTMTVPDAAPITAAISGVGGTLTFNGGIDLNLGPLNPAGATTLITLNMAGLSNFVYNSPANTFRVGTRPGSNPTSNTALNGEVTLAANNTITTALFAVSDQSGPRNPGTYTLHLGGTNALNATNFNVAYSGRSGATVNFATGLTNPTVTIRGLDGTSAVTSFNIGNIANNTGTTWAASVDLSAGTVDALVTSMVIGSADPGTQTARQGTVNASFAMGAGTVNVTNLTIGQIINPGGGANSPTAAYNANGTFTMSSANGTLNAGTINLAVNTFTPSAGGALSVSGTFNLTDGTVRATTIQLGAQTGVATTTAAFNWAAGTIENTTGSNLSITGVPVNVTTAAPTFNVTGTNTITVDVTAVIGGTGGINKTGPGTLVLAAANTYVGPTAVKAGTLLVNGNQSAATGAVTVGTGSANTGTLGGNGTLGGVVTVASGGTIAPGASIGALTVGGAVFQPSGSYLFEFKGDPASFTPGPTPTAGTDNDTILSAGTLDLAGLGGTNGTFNLNLVPLTSPPGATPAVTYTLGTFGGGVNGSGGPIAPGTDVSNLFNFSGTFGGTPTVSVGNGGAVTVTFQPVPVPEAGMILLACAAAAGGTWWRQRAGRRPESVTAA